MAWQIARILLFTALCAGLCSGLRCRTGLASAQGSLLLVPPAAQPYQTCGGGADDAVLQPPTEIDSTEEPITAVPPSTQGPAPVQTTTLADSTEETVTTIAPSTEGPAGTTVPTSETANATEITETSDNLGSGNGTANASVLFDEIPPTPSDLSLDLLMGGPAPETKGPMCGKVLLGNGNVQFGCLGRHSEAPNYEDSLDLGDGRRVNFSCFDNPDYSRGRKWHFACVCAEDDCNRDDLAQNRYFPWPRNVEQRSAAGVLSVSRFIIFCFITLQLFWA